LSEVILEKLQGLPSIEVQKKKMVIARECTYLSRQAGWLKILPGRLLKNYF
jgi:hypothetical protein